MILGRGSQYILDDHPEAYHLLLIDEEQNRVKFLMEHYDLPERRARNFMLSEDKRRLNLFKKLGKKNYDHPELYHLVINMNRFSLESALKLIVSLVNN